MEEIAVKLENITKTFFVYDKKTNSIRDQVFGFITRSKRRKIEAIKPLDLTIRKGEIFGIIGRNGSGKSTLVNIILGTYPPDKGGKVTVNGKMIRMALGMGFDGQLTARENIYINGSVLGLTFKEIDDIFDEIIAFAELEDFIDTKVKFYSKGMKSRLTFAIAMHATSEIFLFDEFFGGVGDLIFREKSEKMFQESLANKRTIVLVSHSMETIKKHCNRVLLLDKGKPVIIGGPIEVIRKYREIIKEQPNKNLLTK